LLAGEPGVGKTRLAEELEARVRRRGVTTAIARCSSPGARVPYAPVTAWLRSASIRPYLDTLPAARLTEVARLLPELLIERPDLSQPVPLVEGWQRQPFCAALVHALLSAPPPLLLLLDDLHWCDQATLGWLEYLLRGEPGAQVLLLGTV